MGKSSGTSPTKALVKSSSTNKQDLMIQNKKKEVEDKVQQSSVDKKLVEKAIKALLKYHSEKVVAAAADSDKKQLLGTDAAIQVEFGLEVAPLRPHPSPRRIVIPHPIRKVTDEDNNDLEEPEVCLIVKEESKPWVQEMIDRFPDHMGCVKKVLGLESLRKKHSQFQQRRALLHRFNVFMADDRILPMLTKSLGKDFYKAKKQPIPIRLTRKEALPFAIRKALTSTYMTLSSGTCVNIRSGYTNMQVDALVANVCAIVATAVPKMPRQWANIRQISIKTPESTSLPIYNKTPEELAKIAEMAGLQAVWKDATSSDEEGNGEEEDEKEETRKRGLPTKSPLLRALKKQKKLEATKAKVKPSNEETVIDDDQSESDDQDATKKAKVEKSAEKKQVDKKAINKKDEISSKKKDKEAKKSQTEVGDDKKKETKRKAKDGKPAEKASPEKKLKAEEKEETKPFLSTKKFKGSKAGYVFKRGEKGIGYYIDVKPVVDDMVMDAILRSAKQGKRTSESRRHSNSSGRKKNRR